jgi:hypothetical protein
MKRSCWLVAAVWLIVFAGRAQAHFLFVRILPPAEGGRAAELYFSEYAAAGDPRYIDKVAPAKLFVQTTPGDFRPLEVQKLSDRLRAHLPLEGTLMVAGELDYGVLTRPMLAPFLLRHYSKAVAGKPEDVNRLQAKGSPLEIVARFDADAVVLTALLNGKPVPSAKFTTVDSDLTSEELAGDASGQVRFVPGAPGVWSVYIQHLDATPGEHKGESYKEVRQFATLSFSWPLARSDADDEAVGLFEGALAARAAWHDFPGFTAEIAADLNDRPFTGTAKVAADGSVALDLGEDPVPEWLQQQLESITMHRAASQTPSAERPKPVIRFADEHTDHPLGRLLAFEGGHFATSYRVRDKQITSVNRFLDGQDMTITTLANERNADGQFLPRSYLVQYWDDASGKLVRTESVQDTWVRVGRWDLPQQHTVTGAGETGFTVRTFVLSKHKLAGEAGK